MVKQWTETFSELIITDNSEAYKLHRSVLLHTNVAFQIDNSYTHAAKSALICQHKYP
jgi:hypothetical protein